MIKRILVPVIDEGSSRNPLEWGIEMARLNLAELTLVPMIDPESWKADLSAVVAAGYAARVLEQRPWETASVRAQDLELWCRQMCGDVGVEFEFREPPGDPLDWLAELARSHDLLVFPASDAEGLYRLIRKAATPILSVRGGPQQLESVFVPFDGSAVAARTIKQFVHMRMWPEAQLTIVWTHGPADAAAGLAGMASFCKSHGYRVVLGEMEGSLEEWLHRIANPGSTLLLLCDEDRTLQNSPLPVFMSH